MLVCKYPYLNVRLLLLDDDADTLKADPAMMPEAPLMLKPPPLLILSVTGPFRVSCGMGAKLPLICRAKPVTRFSSVGMIL